MGGRQFTVAVEKMMMPEGYRLLPCLELTTRDQKRQDDEMEHEHDSKVSKRCYGGGAKHPHLFFQTLIIFISAVAVV